MMRRRAMPARRGGLVRAAATTAVVAGTATAVSGRVARHQETKAQQGMNEQMADQAAFESQQQIADLQAQMSQMQAQQAQGTMAPPPAAPAGGSVDVVARLQQLGQLKDAGLLSDEEFAAAKAQLLGG